MAFSPRFFGESMNNPKDITMAAGYMVSYLFILKFLKQLPKPSLKTAIGLGLSIGMAMGIRIGGLLLIPYTFLFYGLAMWSLLGFGNLFDFSKFKNLSFKSVHPAKDSQSSEVLNPLVHKADSFCRQFLEQIKKDTLSMS